MGGKPSTPKTYSPAEEAAARIQEQEAAAKRAAEAAEAERVRKEAEEAKKRAAGDKTINQRYSQGKSWGVDAQSRLGFADTYGLLDDYTRELGRRRDNADRLDTNFNDDFDYESIWDTAKSGATARQRGELDRGFRDRTGVDWQKGFIGDESDDSILNDIMGGQYDESFNTLNTARQRGQLSQGAYDAAVRNMDTNKSSAMSTLQDLGGGVLSGYRDDLTDLSGQWNDLITGYKLGDNVDLGQYDAQLGSSRDSNFGRMRGDITRALGDTMLFDTNKLIARGNAAGGVSNSPLKNAFLSSTEDPERTTGTAGVF